MYGISTAERLEMVKDVVDVVADFVAVVVVVIV
jgi:hypothetical protein